MAKFFRNSAVVVLTFREDSGYPVDQAEYRVCSLGRGHWLIEDEDGYRRILRTAALQRFFRPRSYECGYYSSGEPVRVYEEVYITRS